MEKICTINEIKNETTPEMLNEIKKESKKIYHRVSHNNSIFYEHKYISNRAREIAFKGAIYKDKSEIYKNLLAANIAFPDEKRFISTLVEHGFTMDKLNEINNPEAKTKEVFPIVYNLAIQLKKQYGSNVTTLALTKINEVIVYNPTLFAELEIQPKKPIR